MLVGSKFIANGDDESGHVKEAPETQPRSILTMLGLLSRLWL